MDAAKGGSSPPRRLMSVPKYIIEQNDGLGETCILHGWRGSVAHGMWEPPENPNSIDDKDTMAICIPSLDHYCGLREYGSRGTHEIKQGEWDIVIYEARKAIRMLAQGNPNILSLLWLPDSGYIKRTPAGDLLLENRELFVGRHVYQSFVGYAKGQFHKMTRGSKLGYMGAKRMEIVERYGYDCHIEDTEFLTQRGWLRYDDILDGDKLGGVDDAGRLVWQLPVGRIKRPHDGRIFRHAGRYTDFAVTEGHRMLVSPCHRSSANGFSSEYSSARANWRFSTVAELLQGRSSHFHVRTSFAAVSASNGSEPRAWLELWGAFAAEGCFAKYNEQSGIPRCARLSQVVGSREFVEMVDSWPANFEFRRYVYPKGAGRQDEVVWVTHNKALVARLWHTMQHGKRLPSFITGLTPEQADIMLYAAMLGDGTRKKQGSIYYSKDKLLADDVQLLALTAGRDAAVYGPYDPAQMYQVYVTDAQSEPKVMRFNPEMRQSGLRGGSAPGGEWFDYAGNVVCFTVPTGTLVTRRNGRIAIHGNCKNAAHLIRLLRVGIEFLRDGFLRVDRGGLDATELLDIKHGEWTLKQVQAEAEVLFRRAEEAYDRSTLPLAPDRHGVNRLCVDVVTLGLR